jgi:hypothetical protein
VYLVVSGRFLINKCAESDILFRKLPFARAATTELTDNSVCNKSIGNNKMGRPLNKKYFTGVNSPIAKLEVTANIGGEVVTTNIVRQRSNTKYEVVAGTLGTEQTGTSLTFADADPDTIADAGADFADFTTVFTAGEYVVVANANTPSNNGIYLIDTVAADLITLADGETLTADVADTTATLYPSSGDTTVCKLVDEASPSVAGTMSIAVSPVTGGTEYARIINAHQVKTFAGNTYAWPDLAAGNFRGPDGDTGPQFEEADLQT